MGATAPPVSINAQGNIVEEPKLCLGIANCTTFDSGTINVVFYFGLELLAVTMHVTKDMKGDEMTGERMGKDMPIDMGTPSALARTVATSPLAAMLPANANVGLSLGMNFCGSYARNGRGLIWSWRRDVDRQPKGADAKEGLKNTDNGRKADGNFGMNEADTKPTEKVSR